MTAYINKIADKAGVQQLPVTHERAVRDDNGTTLESKMQNLEGAMDKAYVASSDNGMGRITLKKNMVSGVNTLTQSMMQATNTIYVIQYDFTLGEDITVPANCVLEFDGGSINGNYSVSGFKCNIIYPENFGAKGDGVTDDRQSINNCFNNQSNLIVFSKNYFIGVSRNQSTTINCLQPKTDNHLLFVNDSKLIYTNSDGDYKLTPLFYINGQDNITIENCHVEYHGDYVAPYSQENNFLGYGLYDDYFCSNFFIHNSHNIRFKNIKTSGATSTNIINMSFCVMHSGVDIDGYSCGECCIGLWSNKYELDVINDYIHIKNLFVRNLSNRGLDIYGPTHAVYDVGHANYYIDGVIDKGLVAEAERATGTGHSIKLAMGTGNNVVKNVLSNRYSGMLDLVGYGTYYCENCQYELLDTYNGSTDGNTTYPLYSIGIIRMEHDSQGHPLNVSHKGTKITTNGNKIAFSLAAEGGDMDIAIVDNGGGDISIPYFVAAVTTNCRVKVDITNNSVRKLFKLRRGCIYNVIDIFVNNNYSEYKFDFNESGDGDLYPNNNIINIKNKGNADYINLSDIADNTNNGLPLFRNTILINGKKKYLLQKEVTTTNFVVDIPFFNYNTGGKLAINGIFQNGPVSYYSDILFQQLDLANINTLMFKKSNVVNRTTFCQIAGVDKELVGIEFIHNGHKVKIINTNILSGTYAGGDAVVSMLYESDIELLEFAVNEYLSIDGGSYRVAWATHYNVGEVAIQKSSDGYLQLGLNNNAEYVNYYFNMFIDCEYGKN